MSEVAEEMKNRLPFSRTEAFETGLKKYSPTIPEEGLASKLTDGLIPSAGVNYSVNKRDEKTPQSEATHLATNFNVDVTINPEQYLPRVKRLYIQYTQDKIENKQKYIDFPKWVEIDLSRKISAQVDMEPRQENLFIKKIGASLEKNIKNIISDFEEAKESDNIINLNFSSDWGKGGIDVSYKQENIPLDKTRKTKRIGFNQELGPFDISGKGYTLPGTDNRGVSVRVDSGSFGARYAQDRRGGNISRQLSGSVKPNKNLKISGEYDWNKTNKEYNLGFENTKTGTGGSATLTNTPELNALKLSLSQKLFGNTKFNLGLEDTKYKYDDSRTRQYTGGFDTSLLGGNTTLGGEVTYTPSTDKLPSDTKGRFSLKHRFDDGGEVKSRVELPTDTEKQLVSVEHNPESWSDGVIGVPEKENEIENKLPPESFIEPSYDDGGTGSYSVWGDDALDSLPDSVLDLRVKLKGGKTKTLRDLGVKYYSELNRLGGQAFEGGDKKVKGSDLSLGKYNDPNVTWMAGEIQQILGKNFGRITAQNDFFHHFGKVNRSGKTMLYYDTPSGKKSGHLKGVKLDFTVYNNRGRKATKKEYERKMSILIDNFKDKYNLINGVDFKFHPNVDHSGSKNRHHDLLFKESGLQKIRAIRERRKGLKN